MRARTRTIGTALGALACALALSACTSTLTPQTSSSSSQRASASPSASSEPSASPSVSTEPAPSSSSQPSSDPAPSCASTDGAAALQAALPDLPPAFTSPAMADVEWDASGASVDDYDPCAALSSITVPIVGATGSSPSQIALFHDGVFIGTATNTSYGFWPTVERVADDRLQVTYIYLQESDASTADASGRAVVQLAWNDEDGSVDLTGVLPPES